MSQRLTRLERLRVAASVLVTAGFFILFAIGVALILVRALNGETVSAELYPEYRRQMQILLEARAQILNRKELTDAKNAKPAE